METEQFPYYVVLNMAGLQAHPNPRMGRHALAAVLQRARGGAGLLRGGPRHSHRAAAAVALPLILACMSLGMYMYISVV